MRASRLKKPSALKPGDPVEFYFSLYRDNVLRSSLPLALRPAPSALPHGLIMKTSYYFVFLLKLKILTTHLETQEAIW